jgi:Coenzyme PQQ synthesis protein D (PqqD)
VSGADETLYVRREDVLAERVRGDTVLLDPEAPRFARLNASAAVLWDELATPIDARALAGVITGRFGIDPERALADTRTLLAALVERALVRELPRS